MRRPLVRTLLLAPLGAALLALAACGRDGGPDTPPDGPPDPPVLPVIDSALTFAFANTTSHQMQGIIHTVFSHQQLATPNPFLLPGFAGAAAERGPQFTADSFPCSPVQTGIDSDGVAIDTDLDGIPDDNSVDFGPGCSFFDGDVEFTWSGKYRLRDPNNGIMDWEYTTTALAAQAHDTLTGDFVRQEVTGTEVAHFTPGGATHQMDVTLEVASGSGGTATNVRLRTKESSSYLPSGGEIFQQGALFPPGTLNFSAEVTFRDIAAGKDSLRFVTSTPTPIQIDRACVTGIDAGELRGLLEGDSRVGFRFTWPGCVDPVLEVFGTTP